MLGKFSRFLLSSDFFLKNQEIFQEHYQGEPNLLTIENGNTLVGTENSFFVGVQWPVVECLTRYRGVVGLTLCCVLEQDTLIPA